MLAFAQPPTFQSDEKFEPRPTQPVTQLDVSDDGRALTLAFSAFEVAIGGTKSPAPTSTHGFFDGSRRRGIHEHALYRRQHSRRTGGDVAPYSLGDGTRAGQW